MRSRLRWILSSAAVIGLGLASRRVAWIPPGVGDGLYATLAWCLAGVVAPRASADRRALAALSWCVTVEISQAFHPPWLDALRSHRLVALVLGRGFLWSDLGCYVVGVGVPWAVARMRGRGAPARG